MLISVVIPTRHRNDLLARCLRRLAPGEQSLTSDKYEVVVTDDGRASTAEAMVRAEFPWARWTAGPGRGPAANRNHGVRLARGGWVAFTDDDCVPGPGWLAAYAAAAGGGADVLEGRTTCEAGIRDCRHEAPINLTGGNLWSCNMMIRRDVFEAVGGFDERFPMPAAEDIDLHVRLVEAGHPPRFVAGAAVDHPPRPKKFGARAGADWQSHVYLRAKHPHLAMPTSGLAAEVFKARVGELWRAPVTPATAVAAGSLLVEALYVLLKSPAWRREAAASPAAKPGRAGSQRDA